MAEQLLSAAEEVNEAELLRDDNEDAQAVLDKDEIAREKGSVRRAKSKDVDDAVQAVAGRLFTERRDNATR